MTAVDTKVSQAGQILGHEFTNMMLGAEAIQMAAPSVFLAVAGKYCRVNSNKRLAVLGDIAIANALCKLWYEALDKFERPQSPAAWTELRSEVLGNVGLTRRGEELGIGDCIIMSGGNRGVATAKMIATTMEALFGAVYLDGGDDAVMKVFNNLGLDQHPSLMIPYMEKIEMLLNAVQNAFRIARRTFRSDL